ncbi:MAG: hypothetical protein II921_06110 [Treponema sp.]|nr:hypothetical protein [Treponema sp.]
MRGNFRSEGFQRWRYVFNGVSKSTGQSRVFFVEMYLVNPAVSPDEVVIAQKSRPVIDVSELISAPVVGGEFSVRPSYIAVKCGCFGKNGCHFNKFLPVSQISWNKDTGRINVGTFEFSSEMLFGAVSVSEDELEQSPELLCRAGEMSWNLTMEKVYEVKPFHQKKGEVWNPSAVKAFYSGIVVCNGEEFTVSQKTSYGYHDKYWAKSFGKQYFHLSSSRLSDVISGTMLYDSYFVFETDSLGKMKFQLKLGEQVYKFDRSALLSCFKEEHECVQVPSHEGQKEKLHWSLSIHKGKLIIDIDVYCDAEELFVRDYEIPQGNRILMKVLGGGEGHGEIKVFKKVKQNLEMISHIGIYNCISEYGHLEEMGA